MSLQLSQTEVDSINLPINVTVTHDNTFTAPYSTFSEGFTQGGSDIPPSSYDDGVQINPHSLYGSSAYFDNDNGIDHIVSIDLSSNFFGVSFWVKFTDPSSTGKVIIFEDSTGTYRAFQIYISSDFIYSGIWQDAILSKTSHINNTEYSHMATRGEWHHMFVYTNLNDSSEITMYLDGVDRTAMDIANSISMGSNTWDILYIANEAGSSYIDGMEICNLHVSTDSNFANEVDTYFSQEPTSRFFKRPFYEDRELFTQGGTDTGISDWEGGASQGQGIIGNSLIGNGTDSWLYRDLTYPTPDTFFACSFMVKNSNNGDQKVIMALTHNVYDHAVIRLSTTGAIRLYTVKSPTARGWQTTTTLNEVDWYSVQISYTFDPEVAPIVYINGVNESVSTYYSASSSTVPPSTVRFRIGRGASASRYFNGELCNLYWSTNPKFMDYIRDHSSLPDVLIEDKSLRPYWTDRELFTQDGYDVDSDYWLISTNTSSGSAPTQGTSLGDGNSYVGNDGGFINLIPKLPKVSDFIGFSFYFNLNGTPDPQWQRLLSLNYSGNTGSQNVQRIFEVIVDNMSIEIRSDYSGRDGAITTSSYGVSANTWYHFFGYVDLANTESRMYIDGVERGSDTVFSHSKFLNQPDEFLVGANRESSSANISEVFRPLDGEICELYWSTNPLFKNEVSTYGGLN
jgi:hypothetical protein